MSDTGTDLNNIDDSTLNSKIQKILSEDPEFAKHFENKLQSIQQDTTPKKIDPLSQSSRIRMEPPKQKTGLFSKFNFFSSNKPETTGNFRQETLTGEKIQEISAGVMSSIQADDVLIETIKNAILESVKEETKTPEVDVEKIDLAETNASAVTSKTPDEMDPSTLRQTVIQMIAADILKELATAGYEFVTESSFEGEQSLEPDL